MSLGLQKSWEFNFRGFSHLKTEKIFWGRTPGPRRKPPRHPSQLRPCMEQKERTRDRSLGTRCSTVDRVETPRQAVAHLQGVPTPPRMGTNPIFGLSLDHHSFIASQGAPTPASHRVPTLFSGIIGSTSLVTPASGGPTRLLKTISQSNVFELDNLPRQAQSFQLDTSTKTTEHTERYAMRPKRSSRAGLASNPDMRRHYIQDTVTLPPANQDDTSSWREEKKIW